MKSRLVWQFISLSTVNVWVCISVAAGARLIAHHWSEVLEGASLPALTTFVTWTANVWPLAFLLFSVVGVAMSARLWPSMEALSIAFTVIVLTELCLASLFVVGAMLPASTITYLR